LVLFLIPLQFVHLFCNQSKCVLLFFSYILPLLLLFFWCPIISKSSNLQLIYIIHCFRVYMSVIPQVRKWCGSYL
jgi:hypothetical protein